MPELGSPSSVAAVVAALLCVLIGAGFLRRALFQARGAGDGIFVSVVLAFVGLALVALGAAIAASAVLRR